MRSLFTAMVSGLVVFGATMCVHAQGIMLSGMGPVNRSMGGAATGAPIDSIGNLYWNPATISGLENELSVGVDFLLPVLKTRSEIAGLGAGVTEADSGVSVLPNVGFVHTPEDSWFTYGLGIAAVAGFSTNYSASTSNPILTPQSNAPGFPGGFGRLTTEAAFLEVLPTVSMWVTDNFSVGFGPTMTVGKVIVDPLVFASPDDADGSGALRYPSGRGTRNHFGGGFQLGAYYTPHCSWSFGASFKSPQWMETFRYKTEDELGRPRTANFDLDLPMIVSVGAGYYGLPDTVIAMDIRYFDYENTDGFRRGGFNADGSVAGLGWDSVFSAALGVQHKLSEQLTVRGGYVFNENPIPAAQTQLGVGAPLYYKHQVSAGASIHVDEQVSLNLAYILAPRTDISGPLVTPTGPVPGSVVNTEETVHLLSVGLTVKY